MHQSQPVRERIFNTDRVNNLTPAEGPLAHLGGPPLEECDTLQYLGQH